MFPLFAVRKCDRISNSIVTVLIYIYLPIIQCTLNSLRVWFMFYFNFHSPACPISGIYQDHSELIKMKYQFGGSLLNLKHREFSTKILKALIMKIINQHNENKSKLNLDKFKYPISTTFVRWILPYFLYFGK